MGAMPQMSAADSPCKVLHRICATFVHVVDIVVLQELCDKRSCHDGCGRSRNKEKLVVGQAHGDEPKWVNKST